jgi:uncharacterized protein
MPEATLTYLFLAVSAFGAGVINAVAGGGTLLTFPALLAIVSPVLANGTSTFALLPGSLASAWGYRDEINQTKAMLRRLLLPSLIGGAIGSLAVTRFPEKVFATLVPWLLVTASTLLVVQKPLMRWIGAHPHEAPQGRTVKGVVFFQFLVGIYGGYFGAGIGILMLSALGFMGVGDIHRMNGLKTVLAAVINGVTIAIFIAEGVIVWKYAFIMAAAAIVGGYIGARVARKTPANVVRAIVVTIGFGVAAYSFYKRMG